MFLCLIVVAKVLLSFLILFAGIVINLSSLVSNFVTSVVFFFKQKTAYEMRISDWSSDVCSSDLPLRRGRVTRPLNMGVRGGAVLLTEIGRASCRERVVSTCRSRWSRYH